jgi:uncharacterized protein
MKIDNIKTNQIHTFCQKNRVSLFIIFGSYAKDSVHVHSDIDIALAFEDRNANVDKLQLIFDLEGIFHGQVDLVNVKPSTDPLLLFEIFSTGKLIYESKNFLFEEYKLLAWKLYLDTQKIRDLRKEYVKKYIRKLEDDFRSVQSKEGISR